MKSFTQKDKSRPLILVFGPTAVGKTDLIFRFFKQGYQIINADSVQVYKHLNIGSAKPSLEEQNLIKHHLLDIREPHEQFTVGDFVHLCDEAVEKIYQDGDIPVITGGTAFYFKHFLFGVAETPASREDIRQLVKDRLEKEGSDALYEYLNQIDPISGNRIHRNDIYRITRAIEVFEQTGKPLSSFAIPTTLRNGMKPLLIGLERDRKELIERINARVDIMLLKGLLQEIESLEEMNANIEWPGLQGIGYKEFFSKEKPYDVELIKEEIAKNSKQYAKRQMTFFKSFENVSWINPGDDLAKLEEIISSYLSSF